MMMMAKMPNEQANAAVHDGTLQRTIEQTMQRLRPEAAYFTTVDGLRTAIMVFDMTDASQMPSIAEPLFNNLHAMISYSPVMNADDLQKGLREALG